MATPDALIDAHTRDDANVFAAITAPLSHQQLRQLDAIYAGAPVALCLLDREGRYVAANRALAAIYDLPVSAVVGRLLSELMPKAAANAAHDLMLLDAGMTVPDHELEWRGRWYQVSVKAVGTPEGGVAGTAVALMEITERKHMERQLWEANQQLLVNAQQDHLTGLLNRRRFDEMLAFEFRRAWRTATPLALVMVDIDHFKHYNDHYGHQAGDECLRRVGGALRSVLRRGGDMAARYGGEEFVLLLPDTDEQGAAVVADTVVEAVRALKLPHATNQPPHVTVSAGVSALTLGDFEQPDATHRLVAMADRMLYRAKELGRNQVARASVHPNR